jgi:hypothetical protein
MSATLSKLSLVNAKKPLQAPPIVQRRNKVSNALHQQLLLAQALAEGNSYAPKVFKTVTNKATGERATIEATKRIKPFWFVTDNGKVCLQVRYGNKVMELAKGKNSIEVANGEELVKTLSLVIDCVNKGELDAQIEQASSAVRARFTK